MTTPDMTKEQLQVAIHEQWAKYDAAVARGLTGAPLVQIDRKLTRLANELANLETRA